MASKRRVHELAKELGVTSRDILGWLSQHEQRVKSASSTLEAPVARRVRAAFGGQEIRPVAPAETSKEGTEVQVPGPRNASGSRTVYITPPEVIQPAREQELSKTRSATASPGSLPARPDNGARALSVEEAKPSTVRIGAGSLPPITADNLAVLANSVVAQAVSRTSIDDVRADLACFGPNQQGEYGYLAWRYSSARRLAKDVSEPSEDERSAHHLEIVSDIVSDAKRLTDHLVLDSNDRLFTDQSLAAKSMRTEFEKLVAPQQTLSRTTAEELRNLRAKSRFLRRAFITTIAHPEQAAELWGMLGSLRPAPTESQLQSSPPVQAASARVNDEISSVALILAVSDDALLDFCSKSSEEFKRLQAGDFDYLVRSGTGSPWVPRADTRNADLLSFVVLEPGEQLRTFLGGLRATRKYRGYDVDLRRLKVLEDLQDRYGAARCRWAKGASSHGVNNEYLVLAIRQAGGEGYEHAVAVSPLAGQHATFLVRGDCCDAEWTTIFANTKTTATRLGARRLVFSGRNPHDAMLSKVVALLECSAADFIRRRPMY